MGLFLLTLFGQFHIYMHVYWPLLPHSPPTFCSPLSFFPSPSKSFSHFFTYLLTCEVNQGLLCYYGFGTICQNLLDSAVLISQNLSIANSSDAKLGPCESFLLPCSLLIGLFLCSINVGENSCQELMIARLVLRLENSISMPFSLLLDSDISSTPSSSMICSGLDPLSLTLLIQISYKSLCCFVVLMQETVYF